MEIDKKYTAKIKVPEYHSKQDKATDIKELYDDTQYKELLKEFEDANVSLPVKEFLKLSSSRFIRFNYNKIAEYYTHANDEVKKLMEDLVLILLDFDKANELGLIGFTDEEDQCQGISLL